MLYQSEIWESIYSFNMVRLIPEEVAANNHFGSMPLAIVLFVSVSALVALCAKAKHVRRAPKQQEETTNTSCNAGTCNSNSSTMAAPNKSPLAAAAPKKLVASISNKAIPLVSKNKEEEEVELDGFGEGGVWQRSILMGEKCQPPEFSGVIYYDSDGNQLSELPPRSPRIGSPLPSFFSPVARDANYS